MAVLVLTVSALAGCAAAILPADDAPSARPSPSPSFTLTLDDQLDQEWDFVTQRFPSAVRPEVEFARYIDQSEWPPAIADCLVGQGFADVKAMPDGGIESGPVPPAQAEAYAVAMYVCSAQYPMDPKYLAPMTDDRIGALYDYYVDEMVPCLEAEGYAVPPAPSRETYIDTYLTGGWTPYDGVAPSSNAEWYRINDVCPQFPSDFYG
jgi:hypothetical protein